MFPLFSIPRAIFPRSNIGFSILDLLISICLFGLILGIGTLSMQRLVRTNELQRTSKEILALLETSAQVARETNADIDVSYDESVHALIVYGQIADAPPFQRSYVIPKALRLETAQFANPAKQFHALTIHPNGSATPGRFTFTDSANHSCDVIQALRGLRRLQCDTV